MKLPSLRTDNAFGRILLLGLLVVLLQIPVAMIGGIGAERERTRGEAAAEIAATWGGQQQVLGPFLVVPYAEQRGDASGWQLTGETRYAVFLPDRLEIDGAVEAQARRRGIFELPVYTAKLTLRGHFAPPMLARLGIDPATLRLDQAQLVLRLADVHAVDEAPKLSWSGGTHEFQPGSGTLGGGPGLHLPLPALGESVLAFQVALTVRGSGTLQVAPLGRETGVALRSNWPHPSFQGAWLPRDREIRDDGFSAAWRIPYVARGFPAAWLQGAVTDAELGASLFGVELMYPVDPYRMTERSLKYAGLFIGLTFLAVWLFEVRKGLRVHPMQYLLMGAGICVFYLLELSLAEHLGFGAAYLLAALAVSLQVGLYNRSVLGAWRRAFTMMVLVLGLYGLLYLLLREEDYALVTGAGGLFAALSAVMFLTRRTAWHFAAPAAAVPQAVDPTWKPL